VGVVKEEGAIASISWYKMLSMMSSKPSTGDIGRPWPVCVRVVMQSMFCYIYIYTYVHMYIYIYRNHIVLPVCVRVNACVRERM
jgi:hypothetical protein